MLLLECKIWIAGHLGTYAWYDNSMIVTGREETDRGYIHHTKRIVIVKQHYQNGETFFATIRKEREMFGKNNVPYSSTEKKRFEKFGSNGWDVDAKHAIWACRGHLEKNIAAVHENVA